MRYIKILMLALFAFSLGVHAADPPAAATYRALDDKLYVLGTDNDFQITFDSSDTRIEIRDAAGNVLGRVSDAGTTGVIGFKQFDVINGSYASQITSGATANRAVTLPDAPGEISLLGQGIASSEITDDTIVNADINSAAAIVPTKLSAGTDGQVVVTASSAAGWGTVPSAGITNGTIINEDINASAAIAVTKLSTSGASADYVLTYNGSAIVWAPAAGTGDIEAGANLGTDNLIPRMDGTGSDTLQGYTSNAITASDAGLLSVPGGINGSTGTIELEGGNLLLSDTSYFKYARDNEVRWDLSYSTGTETGTSGETSLRFTAYDNDGNSLREVMKLNRTASEGVVFGSNTAPSPIYVKGDIYAHTDDRLVIDDGYVRLDALAQTSATLGQSIVWDGTKWAPSSVSVNWGSPGAIGSSTPNSGVFTTLTASSGIFSEAKMLDDSRLSWGTDLDIQTIYDETTDDRFEMSDGTNLLLYVKDQGTEGDLGITGDLYVQDDDVARFGTDSDIRVGYDEATDDRLEWSDGTNLLAYLTDAGTAGTFGVNSLVTTGNSTFGDGTGDTHTFTGVSGMYGATPDSDWGLSIARNLRVYKGTAYDYTPSSTDVLITNSADNSRFIMGQDLANYITTTWNYNATSGSAYSEIKNNNNQTMFLGRDSSSPISVRGTLDIDGAANVDGNFTIGDAAADTLHVNANTITFEGATADANEAIFAFTDPTGDRTITFQNASGTVAYLADLSGGAATKSVAFTDATEVGNVGGGQDDLISESLTAGALGDSKDCLEIDAMVYVKGGTTCIAAIYFGATAIYTNTFAPSGDTRYPLHGRVIRTGAATQIAFGWNDNPDDASDTMEYTTPAETLSGAITVKVTGQSTIGAADNDIKATWMAGTLANTP